MFEILKKLLGIKSPSKEYLNYRIINEDEQVENKVIFIKKEEYDPIKNLK